MKNARNFTIEEQIDCIRREIDFRTMVLDIFADEDEAELERLRRDIALMEAVRHSLGLCRLVEIIADPQNLRKRDESRC